MNTTPTTLLTVPEFAERIRVTPRTVQNLQAKRIIPFIKIGKCVRFDFAACMEALKKHTVKSI